MRIRSVDIRSFGAIRERRYEVSEGMTVFHGPNESGKTTVMEFIRTCMVPSGRRNQYPAREKTDSGTLTYEQDGTTKTVRLVQKNVEGERPRMPTGTDDPALFRSVFAMTPADLDDEKVVTEGGIRARFLTVPGGDALPAARASAEDMWDSSLGRRSNSKSRTLSLDAEIASLESSMSDARSVTEQYGELDRQRSELTDALSRLKGESATMVETKKIHDVYDSNRQNYARLGELSTERSGLGEFVEVTESDESEMARLRSDVEQKKEALRVLQDRKGQEEGELMGVDRRRVFVHSKAIEALPGRLKTYREESRRLRDMESRRDFRETPAAKVSDPVSRKGLGPLFYVGALLVVAGIAAAFLVSPYAIVLSMAGLVVAAVDSLKGRPSAGSSVQRTHPEDDSREMDVLRERMESFENDVRSIVSDLGIQSLGIEDDVAFLTKARDAATALSKIDKDVMRANLDLTTANNNLLYFTQRFSGEEGFDRCLKKTRLAAEIDRETETIRAAISNAGLDPDTPECPVEFEGDTISEEIEGISQQLGSLEERMRAILDTTELERMMDRRAQLESELHDALDDGAVGLLACAIADAACADIYSQVQPGVIATADRYLSMMTDGRYRIDTDPRTMELSVRSGDEAKGIGAWSSGLRAQVLLSVKLAVAKEMGGGEVPVILDDVLLPFDTARKEGACRALAELSAEMQVLMFTCDSETARICSGLEGVSLVGMTVG